MLNHLVCESSLHAISWPPCIAVSRSVSEWPPTDTDHSQWGGIISFKFKAGVLSEQSRLITYHWLWSTLFKRHFFHPGNLCAISVSSTAVGIKVSPLILIVLHSCLLKWRKKTNDHMTSQEMKLTKKQEASHYTGNRIHYSVRSDH